MVEVTSTTTAARPLAVTKARVEPVADTDTAWVRLVFSYLAWATAWLLFGTLVGEYLGIKFVIPDIDHVPWLSFGRLRPVHTNTVFWGWSSLAMVGMALYVVPKTSRRKLFSFRLAYVSLALINLSVFVGDLLLMSGINNGGQEYREYIWPVQAVFAIGVILIAYNLIRTIAARDLEEIYISNWYIMGGLLWTIALIVIAYLPWYQQNGISETVIQGFYMHMAVGMWFTPIVLGLTYYTLPRLLNKPIYSYSLGVLAFWTQMVFYSMIGAHHFIFAPIPWWLQTVAIIFSVGMVVTLAAGSGQFPVDHARVRTRHRPQLQLALHPGRHARILPVFLPGHPRSFPVAPGVVALHELHRGAFAPDDVRLRRIPDMGQRVRVGAAHDRT